MKHYLLKITLAAALSLSMAVSALAQNADDALAVVQNSVEVMLSDLKQNKARYQQDSLALNQLIEGKMLPYFDETRMAAKALGISVWKSATPQQRRDFVNEFKSLLMRSYSTELLNYADASVTYGQPVALDAKYTQVDANITNSDGNSYQVSLKLRYNRRGQWLIVDVATEGFSFITSYGSQLKEKLETIGLQGVIDEYKALNASGAVLQK
ncbi:MAG: hypothetical protein CR957_00220 [Gammaproteobacteria bacterium]|nr:MAG: hypothetical protein CR957_00220 [Gammaproteobacteria bacterium]